MGKHGKYFIFHSCLITKCMKIAPFCVESACQSKTLFSKIPHIFSRNRKIKISPFYSRKRFKRKIRIILYHWFIEISSMSFVIADMKIWIIFFCKCGQIFDHIIISPPCKFLTVFLFCRIQTFFPHKFLAGWTAAFIHKSCIIPYSISRNRFQNFSELLFQEITIRCIYTKVFIKTSLKIPLSLIVLKCSVFINTDPFRMHICDSLVPANGCIKVYLYSTFSASFSLFSQQISVCQMRMDHFRKHFGIII